MKKVNLILLLSAAIGLVGCTTQFEEHTHTFSNDWSKDANKHWKTCTGEDCEEISESADHTFKWVTDTQPSYSAAGSKHEECEICGYKKAAVAIDQLVHNYATTWSKDASKHWKACTDAGFTTLKGEEGNHDYKEVIDTQPSYTAAGSKHNECKVCGYAQTAQTIPQLTHNYASEWSKDSSKHWKACTDAGFTSLKKDESNHTLVADTSKTDVPATETEFGKHYVKCSVCGYQGEQQVDKLPHTHTYSSDWTNDVNKHWHGATCAHTTEKKDEANHTMVADTSKTDVPATDTVEGKHYIKCSVCGYATYESTPTIDHTHTYATEWSKDATNHWHAANCGHDLKSDEAAHTWGDPVVTKEITSTSQRELTYTCTACGQTKVEKDYTLVVEAESSAVYNAAETASYTEGGVAKTCVYIPEPANASNYRGISFTVYSAVEQTVKYSIKAGYEYVQTQPVEKTYGLAINGKVLSESDAESAKTTIEIVQATKTSHTNPDPTKFIESEVGSYTLRAGYNSFLVYSNSTQYNYILLDNIKLEGTAGLELVNYAETKTQLIKDCTSINKQESGSADYPYFGTTTGTGYFEFTVNATKATNVQLVFYVLYRKSTANTGENVPYKNNALQMCKFYVNGTQITNTSDNAAGALPLVKVNDDNSSEKFFARVPLAYVALNQGTNTIRMEFYPNSHGHQNTWKMDVLALESGVITIA